MHINTYLDIKYSSCFSV